MGFKLFRCDCGMQVFLLIPDPFPNYILIPDPFPIFTLIDSFPNFSSKLVLHANILDSEGAGCSDISSRLFLISVCCLSKSVAVLLL